MARFFKFIAKAVALCIGLVVLIFVAFAFLGSSDEPLTDEQRRQGEHCARLDVPPRHQLINIAQRSAKFPDTFERMATGRSSVQDDGRYQVWVRFRAKNAFGVPSRHMATAWVDAKTCKFDLSSVNIGRDR